MTLTYKIEFVPSDGGLAADVSAGRLTVVLAGSAVWDLEWSLVDVLEHLAANWRYLRWEEACPLPVDPHSIRTFDANVRVSLSNPRHPNDDVRFYEFRQAHDLAEGLKGIWGAPLWVLRRGKRFHVWSDGLETWLAEDELVRVLSSLGNEICDKLRDCTDVRAVHAVAAWNERNRSGGPRVLGFSRSIE